MVICLTSCTTHLLDRIYNWNEWMHHQYLIHFLKNARFIE
jgi:hypothetical protein